jgi:hypothetical protein
MFLQASIREQFPQVQVIVKPIATNSDEKIKKLKCGPNGEQPSVIEPSPGQTRIGAFEVQLYMVSS